MIDRVLEALNFNARVERDPQRNERNHKEGDVPNPSSHELSLCRTLEVAHASAHQQPQEDQRSSSRRQHQAGRRTDHEQAEGCQVNGNHGEARVAVPRPFGGWVKLVSQPLAGESCLRYTTLACKARLS